MNVLYSIQFCVGQVRDEISAYVPFDSWDSLKIM